VPVPHPSLIPLPSSVAWGDGHLAAFGPPSGPPEILALLVGYPDAPPTGDFRLEPGLGAEGYRLTVDASGVRVVASATAGLRWAVQTLRQLYAGGTLPHVDIVDRPRYGYRGALLDVARWCHPIGFVRRFVDLMARYKLNTLHLHLTDDQGWRLDVPSWPRLTEVGAWRAESSVGHRRDGRFDGVPHGGFYTRAELRDLVAYAAARGITVMPEIDLPGHMQAAIAAYPELGNEPGRRHAVRTSWGISTHVLNCAPGTLAFARDVLDELVDVFPSEVIHLGGDEVPPDEWAASPDAKAVAAAAGLPGVEALSGWWIREMAAHLATHGRRVAGWDELVDAGAPADTTIFSWRDRSRVDAALAAGHPVVAVPQEYTYLDWPEVDSPDEPIGIPNGFLPLDRVYGFDPGPVLGVQGQLWSEYIPVPAAVEWRAFPRLTAIAEVGWSGPGGDFTGFRARVAGQTAAWDAIGLHYRPLD
jgi:hexosaminidase